MLKTLAVVELATVRSSDSQFSDSCRSPMIVAGRLNDVSLVEWTIRRVTESQLVTGVIAVLGCTREDDAIAELVPPNVPVVQSSSSNPVERILDALQKFSTKGVVRVQLDSPFIDPELIDRLVADAIAHPECDYIGYRSRNGQNASNSTIGVFAEWCRASTLRKLIRQPTSHFSPTRSTQEMYSLASDFNLRLMAVPEQLDRPDVRLKIQQAEDWDLAQDIVDALGPERLDWRGIADLLDHHPALRQRMAALNEAEVAA